MEIKYKSLDKFLDYLKNFKKKTINIDDSISYLKTEIISLSPKINIEITNGVEALSKQVPYTKKEFNNLKKFIESDHVIPIKQPSLPKQPSFKKINNSILKDKKIDSKTLKKEISKMSVKWLLDNEQLL